MKNVVEFPDHNTIEAEASAWIARLDRGALSMQELQAVREWINRSPEHYAALKRLAGLWSDLDSLAGILKDAEPQNTGQSRQPASGIWTTTTRAAVLTMLVVAAGIGLLFLNDATHKPAATGETAWQAFYQTAIGERLSLVLRDGSRVQLNTDTVIDVDFDDRQRKIRLVKGEALFEVFHDRERPFLVYAGASVIRAIGTAFVVKLRKDEIEVTVTEGRVELKSVQDAEQHAAKKELTVASATITARQTARFNKEIQTLKETGLEEIHRKLAWREGLIVFNGEPLSYVVDEVSRYTPVKFIITDPRISDIRIGGRFRIGETDAMLEALESGFGLEINRLNDELVYLSAATK